MLPRRRGEAAGEALRARPHRPHGPEKRVWRDQDLRQQSPFRQLSRMECYGCDHPTAFDASGSGRPHHHLCNAPIPLPPLAEQRRIVTRIDELFAEIAEGEAALERARRDLDVWRRALLKAAVTGE